MIKYLLITSFVFVFVPNFGQEISFEQDKLILEHPRPENTIFNYPFVPLDYNNDGITDFAGSSFGDQFYYKGNPDGSFEEIILNWPQGPIKVMDWDADGDLDVIFQQHIRITNENDEFILINPSLEVITETISDAIDINGDSYTDFVTINRNTFGNNEISIYINNGENSFEKTVISNSEEYEIAIFGDVSLDGIPDIIFSGSSTHIGINNGDGTFVVEGEKFSQSKDGILLSDLDNDNDLDLIILTGIVTIYFNENGIIEKSSKTEIFEPARIIKSGDLNNDGMSDLVTLVYADDSFDINLMRNMGNGSFDQFSTNILSFPRVPAFGIPRPEENKNNITLYDHDQDGRLDIIYIEGVTEPNSIRYLRNNTIINSTKEIQSHQINVFPNPAKNIIQLEIENLKFDKYEILDISGKLIKANTVQTNQISIEDIPVGEYLIKLHPSNPSAQIALGRFSKI